MAASIVLAGTFEPGGIAGSYRRAFEAAGCGVTVFDFSREVVRNPWVRRLRGRPLVGGLVEGRALEHLNYQLSDLVHQRRPDLLITNNGTFLLPGTVAAARRFGCHTVNLWGEPVLHLNLWNVLASLPFYDTVLAFTHSLISDLTRAGAPRVEYLPLAYDPDLHPAAGALSEEGGEFSPADVLFIGKWSPERERLLRELCHLDLAVWGDAMWKRYTAPGSPVQGRWKGRPLVGKEYAQACASAKVCLNFVEPAAADSANMRTFELAGMGRFTVAPRNQAHQDLFSEGEEIVLFDGPAELRETVERYLGLDDRRELIGQAARVKTLAQHTYAHRVRRVLEATVGLGTAGHGNRREQERMAA